MDAEPAPGDAEWAPGNAESAPKRAGAAPVDAEPAPIHAERAPGDAEPAPRDAEPAPIHAEGAPRHAESAPRDAESASRDAPSAPRDAELAPGDARTALRNAELARRGNREDTKALRRCLHALGALAVHFRSANRRAAFPTTPRIRGRQPSRLSEWVELMTWSMASASAKAPSFLRASSSGQDWGALLPAARARARATSTVFSRVPSVAWKIRWSWSVSGVSIARR